MTRLRIACAALAACAWIVGASVVQAQQVSVTHLHAFKHESGASQTVGSVHLGRDGKLHGLAEGLVWEMAVDGSGYTTYALPDGIMTHQYGLPNMATSTVADQNGNIYGATYIGGGTSMGLMFRFDESGTASEVLAPTQVDRPAKISQATGNMAVDAAGNVYVLDRGSSVGTGLREGAIKRLSADQSAFTVVHQMTPETGSNAAVVIVGSDGWLYGVAGQGGDNNAGTIFRLRPNGADFQVLHHFTAEQGQPAQYRSVIPDYGSPRNAAGLAESGAWLVGSTSMQGPHDNGALYRIRKDGTGFQILHGFDDAASQDGKIAAGGLVTGPDGNIYGTTAAGGAHGDGTLFRIVTTRMDEPNGGFESLHAFKADVDGKTPFNLTLGHDGKLYGNTAGEWGGVYQGSVYAVDTGYVPPADPPVITLFRAAPDRIDLGQYTTLAWAANNVAACTAGGAWQGERGSNGTEVITPTTPGFNTFTLSCTGHDGSTVQESATVEVVPPADAVIQAFTATPVVAPLGSSITLDWKTVDALDCTASGDWSGDKPGSGSETVTPSAGGEFSFRLDCRGAGADANASVQVRITLPAVIEQFAVDAASLEPGATTMLRWRVRDASQCQASGAWSGEQAAAGELSIQPAEGEHNYTLRCTGEGGNALSTVRVVVAAAAPEPDGGNGGALALGLLPLLAALGWRRRYQQA
ncbi:choice-of-anchor tandem repeat GloVer-containing protein [Kerstersia gyiorum]|uniref:choice-of-anchor tandem repeat GloVer-containing protein n=1 Tax=Kerstersia gyiorum TaxID=206506 RepID=UPI0020A232BF|nr:choice-of-anchor tandem repeat GloVer-containing protein [Kerstersia gyiorum]MCP1631859.1 uncharacterized protein (TIGR03382 family) [Kerstersia gyiorum]MCP1637858.1 uncharacterized protein (TIGR03382 family) [Kerstersia gyiorum]MCP1672064.1 uncharacterized protein (TIGR03382 family) [Kerstersia gyiorum]MCP1677575.1 uncharacterized protein (TIGR03382 family) [Kerstersia gyiorum]MCP1681420.1 uncharacterized protein (TIGR03382 family) [Kerstersia gyiorum]